ncbi:VOC family protein [Blastococcus xanthinilyticus]|uniref:Putative enzyme related to lactoylglutathione lyase n=1 Tax=Blastococcus xanthinilyticus TaxID=1564164 RepID=A0A5S5D2Y1_9ACTN|nr:VOC family protein [Blastococcus xanthinilyticus]TYP89152.1 putative enzyme related to lactoylglutathione lyase [Blastococcus xanthinilyticus]
MSTVQPILVTPDPERLRAFYTGLLDDAETERFPAEGPAFYLGLRVGDTALGLTADDSVSTGEPGRVLLGIEVPDVDALLPRVAELGGTAPSGSADMPWGQRVAHVTDPDGNALNLTQQL